MRLRLTLDRIVLLDISLLEPEDAEPDTVHDLTGDNTIGFTSPLGWTPDREPDGDE